MTYLFNMKEEAKEEVSLDVEKLRDPLFIIFVGSNGTGKTTMTLNMLNKLDGGGLIVDPEGMEEAWRKDYPVIQDEHIKEINNENKERCLVIDATDETFEAIQTDFKGRFLVVDDCRYYMKRGGDELFHKITIRRRQIGIDIFASCHGITEVPSSFWTFATHAIIFKTSDNYKSRKPVMNPDIYEKIENAIREVNSSNDFHANKLIALK